ncbi:MAG: ROK family transcriptional regulator [Burkholderiaceae bacterium]
MVSKSISTVDTGNTGGGPGLLRKVHRAMALRELAREPGVTRVDLAGRLGLSSMAVGRIVRELEEAGLAGETNEPVAISGRGRPAAGLQLNESGAYVVSAVISAFSQEVNLLNLRGETIASEAVNAPNLSHGPATIGVFCKAIKRLIRQSQIDATRVTGAGFAVAASVDAEQNKVTGGGYLGWSAFDLGRLAHQALNLPVTVNNIADALLRAETFVGCARESQSAVLIHSSTILGASFSSKGHLVPGASFQAGMIGHFPMRPTRLTCSCGSSDCLNCTASGWAILTRLGLLDSKQYQLTQIHEYSRLIRLLVAEPSAVPGDRNRPVPPAPSAGDLQSITRGQINRLSRDAGATLAKGLRYLELTLDPDLIILAGPLSTQNAYFEGVAKGLSESDSRKSGLVESHNNKFGGNQKLVRGKFSTAYAAGIIALLDTAYSPTLDIERLTQPGPLSNSRIGPQSDRRPGSNIGSNIGKRRSQHE